MTFDLHRAWAEAQHHGPHAQARFNLFLRLAEAGCGLPASPPPEKPVVPTACQPWTGAPRLTLVGSPEPAAMAPVNADPEAA